MEQPQATIPPSRKAYAIMIAFGLVLALLGATMMLGDQRLAADGLRAEGVVTGFDGSASSANALITFTDNQGARHTFRAGSNRDLALSEGEQVQVLYDPADPALATVDSFAARSLLPWSFLGFGLLLVGLGLASIAKLRRTQG